MNDNDFEKQAERTDEFTDKPVNSDIFADRDPADPAVVHHMTPMGGTVAPAGQSGSGAIPMYESTPPSNAGSSVPLLSREESERFRTHWNDIQTTFVDEPRDTVQRADMLVTEVIDQLTRMFAIEHTSLESQWKQGGDVSTEDLRMALQRYRSFFNRLVV